MPSLASCRPPPASLRRASTTSMRAAPAPAAAEAPAPAAPDPAAPTTLAPGPLGSSAAPQAGSGPNGGDAWIAQAVLSTPADLGQALGGFVAGEVAVLAAVVSPGAHPRAQRRCPAL